MDYDDVIQYIGELGTYQKRMLFIVFFPVIFGAFSTPLSNFILGDHKHRCKIPWLNNDTYAIQDSTHATIVNQTIPVSVDGSYDQCSLKINGSEQPCHEWVYDQSVFTMTVSSQFNLVCENKVQHANVIMTYFIGQTISPILTMPIADIFGRRYVICIVATIAFAVNIVMPFSPNVYIFGTLRLLDGFIGVAVYQTSFVIGIELMGVSKRRIAGTGILLLYCFGEYILTLLAYFIRDWRTLQLAIASPMVLLLAYWWPRVLPESVRWLISKGRNKEALEIIYRAAKTNKVCLPSHLDSIRIKDESKKGIIEIWKEFLGTKRLIFIWFVGVANWFVIVFIYYGIKLNIGKLGGNLYVSFAVVVTAETIGYSLVIFMDAIGHKRLYMIFLGATGVSCIASIFPVMFGSASLQSITVVFAIAGKCFVSASFGAIYIYIAELFPTVVRVFALGSCMIIGKCSSLAGPYLYHLAEGKLQKGLPLILYGVFITIVTMLTSRLPDTTKHKLSEQVSDVKEFLSMKGNMKAVPYEDPEEKNKDSLL